ncbi:MAG: IS110 family transposase [Candidatus Atribacteria bacterium]|nr:IS110 family transposase [Candidatus Atribacteria bacterium]
MQGKYYGGFDIHKESITGCILDEQGNVIREHKFPVKHKAVERFTEGIPNSNITFAIEACGMWQAVYRILSDLGYTTKLANPKKTHDIACNKKTDKVDARTLADLLRTRYLPEVWIPTDDILQLREITRYKSNLTRMRVQIQLKIKSTLLRMGIPYEKNIWTKAALKEIEKTDLQLKSLIHVYNVLIDEEKNLKKRIEIIARSKNETTLLLSLHGVGPLSALIIFNEIGDIHRFDSPKKLICYAGLCPGIYQTGDTQRTVKNNMVNKWLKWIMYECSWKATNCDPRFQRYFSMMEKKTSYQTARRATARKMLTIIWHMLMKNEPYRYSISL